jgi:hypothetical protein
VVRRGDVSLVGERKAMGWHFDLSTHARRRATDSDAWHSSGGSSVESKEEDDPRVGRLGLKGLGLGPALVENERETKRDANWFGPKLIMGQMGCSKTFPNFKQGFEFKNQGFKYFQIDLN